MRKSRILPLPILIFSLLVSSSFSFEPAPKRTLDFYFIDSEGGAATLIVTPSAESVLIDAGCVRGCEAAGQTDSPTRSAAKRGE